ncbi:MAG: AAA family ATPase [Rhizobiales bacterium]|nr:AAA family ATPase [Hyphomicrobiales bacterium]
MIGFVLNNPGNFDTFIQAARKLLRTLSRSNDDIRYEVLRWDRDKSTRRRDTDAKISGTLALNDRVFGFATDADAFPALFRLAADGIVDLLPVDLAAVKTAVRAVGIRSLPDDVLVEVVGEPLTLLSAMIKPGRNAQFVLRRLKQIQREAPAETAPRLKSRKPTLDDLHGLGEAAVWGRELAKDLNDYRAGLLPWSDVDRGVLVSGPTGTGKTTFAQALARTCNVPIHIHSLARWQAGGYLNDLLRMMRNAFDEARDAAPCILFVDELDSFGDRDDLDDRNANYQREVINAFLECLDGVEGREGVVVVGATNLPDMIDNAILRPGRLGKHVRIPLPDIEARVGILRHHLGNDLVSEDMTDIAARLEGASGAVIEQAVRDARRKARSERRPLTIADLQHGLPSRIALSDEAFALACVHEAGHVVVGHLLGNEAGRYLVEAHTFREITHDGSAGWTAFRQTPGVPRRKPAYLAQITILVSGIAAETISFGEHTDGGGGGDDSDLRHATLIAAAMEVSYGLGDDLVYLSSSEPREVLARIRADPILRRHVATVLDTCMQRAKDLIAKHSEFFDAVVRVLKDRGSLGASDVERLIDPENLSRLSGASKNGSVTVMESFHP